MCKALYYKLKRRQGIGEGKILLSKLCYISVIVVEQEDEVKGIKPQATRKGYRRPYLERNGGNSKMERRESIREKKTFRLPRMGFKGGM